MTFDSHLPPFCLLFGYVLGSVTSNEPPRYLQGITNDSSLARRIKRDAGEKKKEKICLVEYSGLEPLTSTLPVLRSSQMS